MSTMFQFQAFIKRSEKAAMTGAWAAAVVMLTARTLGLQHSTLLRHAADIEVDPDPAIDIYGLHSAHAEPLTSAISHAAVAYTGRPIHPPPVPPVRIVPTVSTAIGFFSLWLSS